jgi:hypothetical protein
MSRDRSPPTASLTRRLHLLASLAVCGGTLLSAGLAMTGLVGGRVNGRLDTLTHFTPLYLAGLCLGLLLSVALTARLRAATVLAGVAGLLACGALMAPEFLNVTAGPPAGRADHDFKVIEFNVWGGNPHPQRALAWLLGPVRPGQARQVPSELRQLLRRDPHQGRSGLDQHAGQLAHSS